MTDPCECIDIYNHESAMRRLMNLLRDSQNACTDSGCDELPNDPSMPDATGGYMMMMMGWVVVATLLYLFRPGNLRRNQNGKPSPASGDGSGGNPPPPPAPPVH